MKRCPYCAEEIREEAVFCRYCSRKVKGRYNRLIFWSVVIAVIASFYMMHKAEIDRFVRKLGRDVRSICRSIEEIITDLPAGLKAIKDLKLDSAAISESVPEDHAER